MEHKYQQYRDLTDSIIINKKNMEFTHVIPELNGHFNGKLMEPNGMILILNGVNR